MYTYANLLVAYHLKETYSLWIRESTDDIVYHRSVEDYRFDVTSTPSIICMILTKNKFFNWRNFFPAKRVLDFRLTIGKILQETKVWSLTLWSRDLRSLFELLNRLPVTTLKPYCYCFDIFWIKLKPTNSENSP